MQRRRLAAGGRDGGPALRVHPVRPAAPGERRQYADPRRVGAASQLDADLADIHSIMRRNIDEVLAGRASVLGSWRGVGTLRSRRASTSGAPEV